MADLDIRDVSPDDTDAVRAVYPVLRAADLDGRADRPFWSEGEFVTMTQTPLPDVRRGLLAAYDGERVVGGATILLPLLDNLDKMYGHIMVHPDVRGRGVGTALEASLTKMAADEGRTNVIGLAFVPPGQRDDHPYRRFAEARGYALANIEIVRALDLPVAARQLDAWDAEAAPFHAEYRLETFDGPIPDDLAESFCHLMGLLAAEAPTGDIDFEPEVVPVESLRAREKALEEQGRTAYASVAIDSSGEAVADSVLAFSRDDPANAQQWATLVRSDHRGHRLGLAVKLRNLRALQSSHPDVERLWTQNSEDNDHMVSINEKLGFRPVEVALEFQRKGS